MREPEPQADEAHPPGVDELEELVRERRREQVAHVHEHEQVVRAKLDPPRRAWHRLEAMVERVKEQPLPFLLAGGALLWLLFHRRPQRVTIGWKK
jgi:hypothetical protein